EPGLYVRDAIVDNAIVDNTPGTVDVPVLLGGIAGDATTNTVTVDYTTHDGTGHAGIDYTATSGTLTFNPNQTVQTIPLPIPTPPRAPPPPPRRPPPPPLRHHPVQPPGRLHRRRHRHRHHRRQRQPGRGHPGHLRPPRRGGRRGRRLRGPGRHPQRPHRQHQP